MMSLNPWVILGEVTVVVGITASAYFYGHNEGANAVQAQFNAFKTQQASDAAKQLSANSAALAAQSAQYQASIAAVTKEYQDEVTTISSARDAALADRDRIDGQLRRFLSARPSVSGPSVPSASSSASGVDAASSAQLLDGVSILDQWLIDNLSRADQYAVTLNEAEKVIQQDRQTCNGSLPGVTAQ